MAGKFELKLSPSGKYHFNLKASNGQVILSSQMYKSKSSAMGGIDSVKNNGGDDNRFERKTAKDDSPFFTLKAGNGEPIGKSEMYNSVAAMENGIASVIKNSQDSKTVDATAD